MNSEDRVWRPDPRTEIRQVSFKDVLRDLSGEVKHIDQMADFARMLGYSMFLWNERVYALRDGEAVDTTLMECDVL